MGAPAVAMGLAAGPADPAAVAAPSAFTIHGAGYGHGIALSQYGARGMAVRGYAASRILSFYYGGAKAGSVAQTGADYHVFVTPEGECNGL